MSNWGLNDFFYIKTFIAVKFEILSMKNEEEVLRNKKEEVL